MSEETAGGTADEAETSTPRGWLGVYLRGAAMGTADSIPGVSGGTIALITGIYERLIDAITALDPAALTLLPGVVHAEGRARLRERLVEMDVPFLVVLGLGVLTALVTMSRTVHAAYTTYTAPTAALFFGLIAASAVVLYSEVHVNTPGRAAAALAGFLFALAITDPTASGSIGHSPAMVLLSGAVAISAMILPGISGAFILYLLGQYVFLTGRLSTFVDAVVALPTGGDPAALVDPGTVVVTFGVGAVVGLFTVAYIVDFALERARTATLAFLVSLMVGALRAPAHDITANTSAYTVETVGVLLAAGLFGAGLVLGLDYVTDDFNIADAT